MAAFDDPALAMGPAEASRRHADGELVIVDVREQYEWDAGHVPGTRHLEIERVASRADTLDRGRPVAFLCRLGTRAAMVAHAFHAIGYDAYTVAGGFTAWHEQGLPVEPADATVAPH